MKATEVTAGLAESNGRLLLGLWRDSLHVPCGLTACTPGSAPGPTPGNEYGKIYKDAAYCTSCGLVCLSVRPSVRLSVTTVSRTQTAELIEMPFGMRSRVGPRNDVLGDDRPQSSMGCRGVVRRGRGFFRRVPHSPHFLY